ncbi:uncharacterized protein LODBEIA_P24750 [Lodderomyces beijingensis]|uniref:Glutamine amidotransferase domain-containing protein n=1 Tax=Lodderomyces beijingensis TaxID=1775926 RepID=A0ABP0ZMW6_9ASCO
MAQTAGETEPHIAVLVLDTPIAGITDKYGDFGDNTIDLLTSHCPPRPPYKLIKYQLKHDDVEELEAAYARLLASIHNHKIRGFVLTGSRSDAFEEYPWLVRFRKFLRNTIFKLPWPLVGICFGHQVVAQCLGCKIDRNTQGWEAGIITIDINDEIYKLPHSPFTQLYRREEIEVKNDVVGGGAIEGERDEAILYQHLNMVESHRDIVFGGVPNGFLNFGSTSKCPIQGMVSVGSKGEMGRQCKVITFQGHPEFTTEISLDILKNMFERGSLTQLEYEKAKYHTSTLNNQGDLIGKVICKFLSQEIEAVESKESGDK